MSESPNDIAVRLKAVSFQWPGGDGFRLEAPNFVIDAGERALLLGESGSGKSTLLSLICGVVAPRHGAVEIGGADLAKLSSSARDRFRANNIGVIFQQFNLLPYATPLDNILLALRFAPERRGRVDDARKEALSLAAALRLPEALVKNAPASALSVGQQQRVAMARALIGRPSLIVADEPTSSIDVGAQAAFLDLLFAQVEEAGSTLLMVSHNERLGRRFDRVVDLDAVVSIQRGAAA